jgi:hypothetical protein
VQVYNTIKALESHFPLPQPRAEVNMGTFDVATGRFTGVTFTTKVTMNPVTKKPMVVKLPGVAEADGVAITLRFTAMNGSATFTVTPSFGDHGTGATTAVVVPAGQTGTVDVGRASFVAWRASGGSVQYNDEVTIKRPKIVGVGAFTVPAIPAALVYEPPSVGGGTSSQTYTVEQSVGTAVKMEFSQENSLTTPGSPSQFAGLEDIQTLAGHTVQAFNALGAKDPRALFLGEQLKNFQTALGYLGTATATNTSVDINTKVSERQLMVTLKRSVSPNLNLGPGKGDVIVALINARLVWYAEDGNLTLGLLGFDKVGTWAVQDLVANPAQTGLDATTVEELLKLDPFVAGGPYVSLPGPRFVYKHSEPVSNATVEWSLSHTITQTDVNVTTNMHIHTEDYRAGLLSFIGIGVDETKQMTTKISHSNSTSVTVGSTTTAEVTLNVVGSAEFDIYFDRVFGTYAIKPRLFVNPALKGTRPDVTWPVFRLFQLF